METKSLAKNLVSQVKKMTRRKSVHMFKIISKDKLKLPGFPSANNNNRDPHHHDDKPPARHRAMTSSERFGDDAGRARGAGCPKRWVLALALCAVRLCHAAMRQNIGIALVCMTATQSEMGAGGWTLGTNGTAGAGNATTTANNNNNNSNSNNSNNNNTLCQFSANATANTEENSTEFHWSSMFEGQVLSAPYYGFLLAIPLSGYLDHALGSCRLLMLSLTVGGLLSVLTPFLTRQHPYLLVASRAMTGAANGVVKPAVFSLWAHWAPVSQRGILTSVEYSGSAIGGILTFFISGFLCSITLDQGWPFVFYVFGSLSLVCALFLGLVVHDTPERHPSISPQELAFISNSKRHVMHQGKVRPPWLQMLKSPAVWAIIAAHASHHWVFAAIVAYLPMYMRDVLQYQIAENGMLSALPFVGSMIAGLVGGVVADRMHRAMSVIAVRKIFQLTGSAGFAALMLMVSWLTVEHRLVAVTLLVGAVTLLNLTSLAYRINCLDIAPRYASFITSLSTTIATAVSLTAPVLTSAILVNKSNEEWQKVLFIVTAVSFAGGVFYVILARGDVQAWGCDNTYDVTVTPPPEPTDQDRRHSLAEGGGLGLEGGGGGRGGAVAGGGSLDGCIVLSVKRLHSTP